MMRVQDEEGCLTGPAFGHKDGSVASMAKYEDVLHLFPRRVQEADSELNAPSDNIKGNYSFSCSFRRIIKGRVRGANLDIGIQNAMNRWRKVEEARVKRPRFDIVNHHSHARDLMPVTWRYLFVQ